MRSSWIIWAGAKSDDTYCQEREEGRSWGLGGWGVGWGGWNAAQAWERPQPPLLGEAEQPSLRAWVGGTSHRHRGLGLPASAPGEPVSVAVGS